MKKVFGIMVTVIMLIAVITAATAEGIMKDHVYDEYYDIKDFQILKHLYDGEDYIEDGIAYEWSSNSCLDEEFAHIDYDELEELMVDILKEHDVINPTVSLKKVGNDVVWFKINTETDLRTIEGMNLENCEEPIYGVSLVAWRDHDHMH